MKTKLDRRTVLKGAGVSIALPLLEAMMSSKAHAAESPQRFISVFFGNGVKQGTNVDPFQNPGATRYPVGHEYNTWECGGSENDWQLSKALQPLNPYKPYLNVVKGLFNDAFDMGVKKGDNDIGHWLSSTSFLTGLYYDYARRKDAAILAQPGSSLDYLIAQKTGRKHLVMGATDVFGSGDDRGVGQLTTQITWKSQTEQVPKLETSKKVFDFLFGDATAPAQTTTEAQRRLFLRKSVLDSVTGQLSKLVGRLGAGDRAKMDEFLTNLREVERKTAAEAGATPLPAGSCSVADGSVITRYKSDDNWLAFNRVDQRANNMIEMLALALQCDIVRTCSFVLTHEVCNYEHQYFFNGSQLASWHHEVSHYKSEPSYSALKDQFDLWHTNKLGKLLGLMQNVNEGGQNLLDSSLVHYGCGMADSQYHLRSDLPILLAGRGTGLRTNRLIQHQGKNYSDFLATLAGRYGLTPKIGLSTGTLQL